MLGVPGLTMHLPEPMSPRVPHRVQADHRAIASPTLTTPRILPVQHLDDGHVYGHDAADGHQNGLFHSLDVLHIPGHDFNHMRPTSLQHVPNKVFGETTKWGAYTLPTGVAHNGKNIHIKGFHFNKSSVEMPKLSLGKAALSAARLEKCEITGAPVKSRLSVHAPRPAKLNVLGANGKPSQMYGSMKAPRITPFTNDCNLQFAPLMTACFGHVPCVTPRNFVPVKLQKVDVDEGAADIRSLREVDEAQNTVLKMDPREEQQMDHREERQPSPLRSPSIMDDKKREGLYASSRVFEDVEQGNPSMKKEEGAANNSPMKGGEANSSMKKGAANSSMKKDEANSSMKEDEANSSMKKDEANSSMKSDEANPSMKKGEANSSMKKDEANSSMQKGEANSAMKKDEANSSMKKDAANSSMKTDEANSSMNRDEANSSMKEDEANSSMKRDEANPSMRKGEANSSMKKGEANSPMKKGEANSSMKEGEANSSMKGDEASSPMEKGEANSPMEKDAANSPMKKDAANSPMKKDEANSSMEKDAANSPMKKDEANPSTEKDASMSVAPDDATNS